MKPANKKINKEWHEAHPMPEKATITQRIEWHLEHLKNCNCRPMPEKLKTQMTNYGYKLT